jgi:hypothetical protein
MASINTQVSQIALSVGDNASRLGQTDNSAVTPTVLEVDVDAVMYGALQQGSGFGFEDNGRIILSSLERDPSSGKQYIHWQRCAGKLVRSSIYGNDTTKSGLTGERIYTLGQAGHTVSAPADQAVMFVEVTYKYKPLLAGMFVDSNEVEFRQEAAFLVRDRRNLQGGLSGTKKSGC